MIFFKIFGSSPREKFKNWQSQFVVFYDTGKPCQKICAPRSQRKRSPQPYSKMSNTLISTLIDAFETKMRSERALWEHRVQTEIASLRQALLSVIPQSINSNSADVLQIQEEQQMLRDMVVDLQDSIEGLNRRFISSKVSLPSEDDEDSSDDEAPKNEIIYPPIHVEKEGAARPEPVVKKAEEPAPAPAPVSTPKKVEAPAPPPAEEEEEEEVEEEEEEEALELEEFTFKGRTLYKDGDGNIYDEQGENVIGKKTEKGIAFFRK